jgi:hypothetical protein
MIFVELIKFQIVVVVAAVPAIYFLSALINLQMERYTLQRTHLNQGGILEMCNTWDFFFH